MKSKMSRVAPPTRHEALAAEIDSLTRAANGRKFFWNFGSALLWCYGYAGDSKDRPKLVAELGLIREALGVSTVRASRTQATAMLARVKEDRDTGSADHGCYWRFCRHAAGIAESAHGQDHHYIQPIFGLVGRLGAIATGRAGLAPDAVEHTVPARRRVPLVCGRG